MSNKKVIDIANIQLNNDIDTRQKIFKFYNSYETCKAIKKCMLDDHVDECDGKIIKAHSISKKNGLSRISVRNKNGVEVVGKFQKGNTTTLTPIEQEYIERYMPIESASTFLGLCSKHDNNLFKKIDQSEKVEITDETVYEYTLRNAIYSRYHRMSNRICADKRRVKFNYKVHDQLYYNILIREKALEKDVNYLLSDGTNNKNKLFYKIYEIDGNLNIAGNFYEYGDKAVLYTMLIPDYYKSYIIMACTKNNLIFDVDKTFDFYTYKDNEELYLSLSELLLQSTNIKHFFFNHDKWLKIPKEQQETFTDWIYLNDLDRFLNVNTRGDIMDLPNFVRAMIDFN